jgi:hypothetical protein
MRSAWALSLWVVCWASLARADLPPRLTDHGRLVPGGSVGGFVASTGGPGLYGYADSAVWLQPSVIYFIRDRIGIGGYVGYDFMRREVSLETNTGHGVSAGVIGAWELALGPKLGLLSMLQLGYLQRFVHRDGLDDFESAYDFEPSADSRLGQVVIAGSLPFLIHASSSVAFGLGPTVRWAPYVLASSEYPRATQFRPLQVGASSWIGVSF